MIARFSLLCLCKGYRHCQRCIGFIRALKLISKGTNVRLLLNIECYSGSCLKVKKETKYKPLKKEKGEARGTGSKAEQIQSGQFSIAPFNGFPACCLKRLPSHMASKSLAFKLQFPTLNFILFFYLGVT